MSNVKHIPGISAEMADAIIAWLDQKRAGPPPIAPHERVQVYTLKDMAVVFVGDRESAIFEGNDG
ncbi:hypothetical protein ACFOKF_15480 [Sphingobium rhizovicinum]|uniref:Uncharacterized protein n=1 Tax=Sphingobium rhizovicinum TaxID=432308 RepID=A0ABV7NHQ0_9SPHN